MDEINDILDSVFGSPDANGNALTLEAQATITAVPTSGKNVSPTAGNTGNVPALSKYSQLLLPKGVVAYFRRIPGSYGTPKDNLLERPITNYKFTRRGGAALNSTIEDWLKIQGQHYRLYSVSSGNPLIVRIGFTFRDDERLDSLPVYVYDIHVSYWAYLQKALKHFRLLPLPPNFKDVFERDNGYIVSKL